MPQITLKREQVVRLHDFCKEHDQKQWFLAKDQGAYVGATGPKQTSCIYYFKGCNPGTDENWWDNARRAFGGDDFGQHFEVECLERFVANPKLVRMVVRVGRTKISIDFFAKRA